MKTLLILLGLTLTTGCSCSLTQKPIIENPCDKFSYLDKREVLVKKGYRRGITGKVTGVDTHEITVRVVSENAGYFDVDCSYVDYIDPVQDVNSSKNK